LQEHTMSKQTGKFALSAFLLGASLLQVACTTSPTGRSQVVLRSDDALAAEAAQDFGEMRASIPLATDRATIDYLHCVATAIVDVLDPVYRELDWDMAIFDNDAVNAFAMPGGKVGVFTGILKAADNQDRLAAVLGHEIAHVTARHSNERASRAPVAGVGIQVAAVLLGAGDGFCQVGVFGVQNPPMHVVPEVASQHSPSFVHFSEDCEPNVSSLRPICNGLASNTVCAHVRRTHAHACTTFSHAFFDDA
jgi:predicted Zn-dependent protease